jgi:hypothetical protein
MLRFLRGMPAFIIIVTIVLGQEAVREIENVSLSNSKVNRRTDHLLAMLKRFYLINEKIAVSLSPG